MSMYRQLWLAVIVSTLLALIGSLLASSLSARSYLSEQLAMKNTDNASALALSLSRTNPDAVEVELAVAALFDSGHYELIRVTDPFGKTLVERIAPAGEFDVPRWFVQLLPIHAPPGRAQISNGWKQIGNITLVSHSRFAYHALWKSIWELAGTLALAGLVSGYLGTLILRRLRAPLNAVIGQAQAISERRFVTIAEPNVPELRQLAMAMNSSVLLLKAMFEEETARLEVLRREANHDGLTGLANRSYFMTRLRESLLDEDALGGSLLLVRVADLADINRRLGRGATDDLLQRFAGAIGKSAEGQQDALAARLNGADFALLLPGQKQTRALAEGLLQSLIQLAAPFVAEGQTAYIGLGAFPRGLAPDAVLAQVDAALAGVEAEGLNGLKEARIGTGEDIPKNAEQWSQLILRALDEHWVRLASFPVTGLAGRQIHRECPLRLRLDEHDEWLPAGRFLPIAERLKLTPRIDLAAVVLGLLELEAHPALSGLAINLSASSIQDAAFRHQLFDLLESNPATARLWLEVAETGAFKHFDAFRALCLELKNVGCRMGIEHFGRQFSQIGLLHELGLDFIKIDASFIRCIESNSGNQAFLKGVCSIGHSIGLLVIAEGVASSAELGALGSIGFDGATGPAVKD